MKYFDMGSSISSAINELKIVEIKRVVIESKGQNLSEEEQFKEIERQVASVWGGEWDATNCYDGTWDVWGWKSIEWVSNDQDSTSVMRCWVENEEWRLEVNFKSDVD